ncbi:MAG: amidohydrolase/deacetylase family metallohydrolase [Chloroflexi bacterium]|nr:amidohydrolase/deacetylase family metallohydrolase [Chloroflexota bacterium]
MSAASNPNPGPSARYDLLLQGGEVFDPEQERRYLADVAIANGRIAAVARDIDPSSAERVIDVRGKLVTPGLIDLHAHGYWGVTYDGLLVDAVAGRSGVTTWVDAGSAGAATFPGFRRYVIAPSRTRIIPFLNLCAIGIIYRGVQEFTDLRFADVSFAVEMVEEHRDLIAGIKLRLGRSIVEGNDDHPIWLAREVADLTGLPIMVHIGEPPPTLPRILAALGPGDVVTHCFRGSPWGVGSILVRGAVRPEVRAARERGVRFDVGHGAGGFSFAVARAALDAGFLPDTISSDLHQVSIRGAARDLPNVLSKFLALGMPLEAVIRRATLAPAQVIQQTGRGKGSHDTSGAPARGGAADRDGLGTLRVGAPADIAVFELEHGEFEFVDTLGQCLAGTQRLVNVLTIRAGHEMDRTQEDYGGLPIFVRSRR